MMMRRTRYQQGSIVLNGSNKWVYRWRDYPSGRRMAQLIGTVRQYPNKTLAQRAAEPLRAKANLQHDPIDSAGITVREVASKYIAEEMSERFSTRKAYLSNLNNHVIPKWGEREVRSLGPAEIELWLKGLSFAAKTKAHLKSLLSHLINSAMRRGYIELKRNPMELVRVAGSHSKRKRRGIISMPQFEALLRIMIIEPFRTMVILALALGLRSCEVVGLKWGDVDWTTLSLHIRRDVVDGRVGLVKTHNSEAVVPIDPWIAEELLRWRRQAPFTGEDDWIFASPFQGGALPYLARGIQSNHLRPAMHEVGVSDGGWHTLRHTYRTMLTSTGAALDVQRDLMRHASIVTTMDVYGDTVLDSLRKANSAVVRMIPAIGL